MARGPQRFAWVGCLLIATLVAPGARAGSGGTITFVGAIVESTCSVATMPNDLIPEAGAGRKHQSFRQGCPSPAGAGATTTALRPHSVRVVPLSTSEHDRVLKYFVDYVRADHPGSAGPMVVIQTYQ